MVKPFSKQTTILIAHHALLVVVWAYFAKTAAPEIIAEALAADGSTATSRLVLKIGGPRPLEDQLQSWRVSAGAVPLAVILHLALILTVGYWDRRERPNQTARRARLARMETGLLFVLSLAFFLATVLMGRIQDYYLYGDIWRETLRGNDPWYLVPGGHGLYPLNAYGPLYLALALPTLLNPLAPKLLFAFAYWMFVAWLLKRLGPDRGFPAWAGLVLLLWHATPFVWVEIAAFGHFDILVGLLCVAAIAARRRSQDAKSAGWLASGVLLKFFPGVLAPFLALERGRVRLGYLVATASIVVAGLLAVCLVWGWSPLRPLALAVGRESAHLSIFRFLRGVYSPIERDALFLSPDQWASPILLFALYKAWSWCRRVDFEMAASCVLAVAVTLSLYKVGFPQYYMVLFVMGSYWLVVDHARLSNRPALIASFCLYFVWITHFNIRIYENRIGGLVEWAGAPTFILAGLLVVSIIRSGPRLGVGDEAQASN